MLLDKLAVCKFYLTAHGFHAGVQSPTCTIYGKYLRESIIAVLTPKSGIYVLHLIFDMLCSKYLQKINTIKLQITVSCKKKKISFK